MNSNELLQLLNKFQFLPFLVYQIILLEHLKNEKYTFIPDAN